MLQPGMCSATTSESKTWLGPPVAPALLLFRADSAALPKSPAVKTHVAAGNLLGDYTREQTVPRPAGGGGARGLDPIDRRRENFRPADTRVIAARERADQVKQP